MNNNHELELFERAYFKISSFLGRMSKILTAFIIRGRKFLALPYCYFKFIDWNECPVSKYQVVLDFIYIFFKLKYYPENYGYCRLWEKSRDEWKYYYGSNYDAYQRYRLEQEVQEREYQILFNDKEVCQQICDNAGLKMANWVGVLRPSENYRAKLESFFQSGVFEKLILKPARGNGGRGVTLAVKKGDKIILSSQKNEVNSGDFIIQEKYIVQEVIEQDEQLSALSSSVSIRLITLYTKSDDVIFLSGELNTAVDGSYLSNWSVGGIMIGVDTETGKLREIGYDKYGHCYKEHPTSKIIFRGFQIPQWREVVDLAIKVQKSFPYFRMLGPDIALSKNGPVLYEINATPDLSSTEQANGPLLANQKIRDEFRKYNLLINNALDK